MQRRKADRAVGNSSSSQEQRGPSSSSSGLKYPAATRGGRKSASQYPANGVSWVFFTLLAVPILATCLVMVATFYIHRNSAENRDEQTPSKHQPRNLNNAIHSLESAASGGGAGKTSVDYITGDVQEYHIVFSTGCSTYQDWQSYVFFYHAWISGQPGSVTRIASGCTDEGEETLRAIFDEKIRPMAGGNRFFLHFTPDYSNIKGKGTKFYYFNKPFGMKHWMEHVLGYPDNPINDHAIVILLDPDQVIIRPFAKNDFSQYETWAHLPKGQTPRTRIEHGAPMGQLYGFDLQWKTKVNMSYIYPHGPSPVDQLTNEQARAGYVVGPPYIATAKDMYQIVDKWCEFGPRVHDQYPHLLAEMFAYCLAAAHLKLSHQTATSFMVSDTSSGRGEGWSFIDKVQRDQICPSVDNTNRTTILPDGVKPAALPHVLHFCQRYGVGKYFFGKRRLRKDFLSCDAPLLAEPPVDLAVKHDSSTFPDGKVHTWNAKQLVRNAFMLCQLLPALNKASEYYKHQNCDPNEKNDVSKIPNFRKTAYCR